VNWVLDADIRGFFDSMSHEWTMKFFGQCLRRLWWLILRRRSQRQVAWDRLLSIFTRWLPSLPRPAFGYVQRAHFGGLDLERPPAGFREPR
jgi:hypothetical protein